MIIDKWFFHNELIFKKAMYRYVKKNYIVSEVSEKAYYSTRTSKFHGINILIMKIQNVYL